jgi:hypothetical protein
MTTDITDLPVSSQCDTNRDIMFILLERVKVKATKAQRVEQMYSSTLPSSSVLDRGGL